jgi:hypothetical protein
MKEEIVYKVVKMRLEGFCSAIVYGARTNYELNKEITAEIGEFFVFKKQKDAIRFARCNSNFAHRLIVLECKATSPVTKRRKIVNLNVTYRNTAEQREIFHLFWKAREQGKKPLMRMMSAPLGTCSVKSLTPIGVVK